MQVIRSKAYGEMLREAPELGQRFTERAMCLAFLAHNSKQPQSSAGLSEVPPNRDFSHATYF